MTIDNEANMAYCPKCGYENPSSANYCMNCGERLSNKIDLTAVHIEVKSNLINVNCPYCGSINSVANILGKNLHRVETDTFSTTTIHWGSVSKNRMKCENCKTTFYVYYY